MGNSDSRTYKAEQPPRSRRITRRKTGTIRTNYNISTTDCATNSDDYDDLVKKNLTYIIISFNNNNIATIM